MIQLLVDPPQLFGLRHQYPFGPAPLGDVVEGEHHPDGCVMVAENGRGAIIDVNLRSLPGAQQAVAGQADNPPLAQDPGYRIFYGQTGFFVDDMEHFFQRPAYRLRGTPPRQLLSHGIQERNSAVVVSGYDRVPNAL